MSENTNPTAEELVRNVTFSLQRSTVVPMPIDPTLSNEGEAADAKATGDAIAAIAAVKKVNNTSPDASGNVMLYATSVPMTDAVGAQTVSEAILSAQAQMAETIRRTEDNDQTVEEALEAIEVVLTDGCTNDEIDGIFDDWEDE